MDNYQDPKPGTTYISPRLDEFGNPERKVRIATKLIEHPSTYAFATVKEELVLRHKEDAKSCITAKFFEDDRRVFVLSIQGYTVATGKPHNASFRSSVMRSESSSSSSITFKRCRCRAAVQ